jgi:hypothetical protein
MFKKQLLASRGCGPSAYAKLKTTDIRGKRVIALLDLLVVVTALIRILAASSAHRVIGVIILGESLLRLVESGCVLMMKKVPVPSPASSRSSDPLQELLSTLLLFLFIVLL